ncbi:MAG: UDP-N-acetylmuramate dehydrogenase [Planctomycetes bacterium]|nr:UDP-N-acetylmuramate dehydrogenase [Planctomycetota bacterium]
MDHFESTPLIRANVSLRDRTSYRVGGVARFFAQPRTEEQAHEALVFARTRSLPLRLLGGGSNLLIEDGLHEGLIIDLSNLRAMRFVGDLVFAGAGAPLARLVHACNRRGLGGMAGLAGIPGTVGGALVMNAGGRHGEIGDHVLTVTVLRDDGLVELPRAACGFRYRDSALNEGLVLSAAWRLPLADAEELRAFSRDVLAAKRRTQPLAARSAGCVFKNPPGVAAGRLIDAAGLKGAALGGARVSEVHANFIVNAGDATSADLLGLMEKVEAAVEEKSHVRLEREVRVWKAAG